MIKFPSKKRRYFFLIPAIIFLLLFYNTRYVEHYGDIYTFKEYNSLVAFNGNSTAIQKKKYDLLSNKDIHIFWIGLNENFEYPTMAYSVFEMLAILCWVIVAVVIIFFITEFFLQIPKDDRKAPFNACIIVILIYGLIAYVCFSH